MSSARLTHIPAHKCVEGLEEAAHALCLGCRIIFYMVLIGHSIYVVEINLFLVSIHVFCYTNTQGTLNFKKFKNVGALIFENSCRCSMVRF